MFQPPACDVDARGSFEDDKSSPGGLIFDSTHQDDTGFKFKQSRERPFTPFSLRTFVLPFQSLSKSVGLSRVRCELKFDTGSRNLKHIM